MATINQLSAANTYQDWLSATETLISLNNDFGEGANGTFFVNTSLILDGDLSVGGNMALESGGFDNLTTNGNLVLELTGTGNYLTSGNVAGAAAARWSIVGDGSNYNFDAYSENNPTLNLTAGETYAFDLQGLSGSHPFVIRTTNASATVGDSSTYYNVGLSHVEPTTDKKGLVISHSADAQGKTNGILYWKVPANTINQTYYYQCTAHASAMVGTIHIENTVEALFLAANNTLSSDAVGLTAALVG